MACVGQTIAGKSCCNRGKFIVNDSRYCKIHIKQSKQLNCAICLEDSPVNEFKMLSCGHYFHQACFKTLSCTHDKCPLCRKSMVPDLKDITRWCVTIHTSHSTKSYEIPLTTKANIFLKNIRVKSRPKNMLFKMIEFYEFFNHVDEGHAHDVGISMQVGPFTTIVKNLKDFPLGFRMYIEDCFTQQDIPMAIALKIKDWMKNYFI